MRHAFVCGAIVALAACTSFSSSSDPAADAGASEGGTPPDAGADGATADAGACDGHAFCETFDEPSPPGADWTPNLPGSIQVQASCGDVGACVEMMQTANPGPSLLHALRRDATHIRCGGDVELVTVASMPDVIVAAIDLDGASVNVIVLPTQAMKISVFDPAKPGDTASDIAASLSTTRFTHVEVDVHVDTGSASATVGGASATEMLPATHGAPKQVIFGLLPQDPGGGWKTRFDQLWCDVE